MTTSEHQTIIKNVRNLRIDNACIIELPIKKNAIGFYELMMSGAPLEVIAENKYRVSEVHCRVLEKKGIEYSIVEPNKD